MPAFSFSAPQFTEDDERREKASLSEEEKATIAGDLYGTTTFSETDDMLVSGPALLEQELLHIPTDEKEAYLEALERCPGLVLSESSAIAFLRGRDYDAASAARGLVQYWKSRKSLFDEKAFLPMTLGGALRDDMDTLELGVVELLPDDTKQRAVIHYEKARLPTPYSRISLLRVLFYILNRIMQKESAQKNGFIYIANLTSCFRSFDRKLAIQSQAMIKESFPMKFRATNFCFVSRSSFFETTIIPVMKHLLGRNERNRLVLHTGSHEDIMASLKQYGIGRESVPTIFGGTATIEDFHAWLRDQP